MLGKVLCLLVLCSAHGHCASLVSGQTWRPAGPRDLSKYRPAPAVIEDIRDVPTAAHHQEEKVELELEPDQAGLKSFDAICGLENVVDAEEGRIIGGSEAAPNQWPWQVLVFMDEEWYCGGTIISDDYIMTAAHCVADHTQFDIVVGAHDVTAEYEPDRIEITSFDKMAHPEWNPTKWYGDIGLIRLPEPLTFNTTAIRPACLPPASDMDDGYVPGRATATGWGKTSDSQSGITPVLHYVSNLPVIDNAACMAWYSSIIYPGMMCIDSWGPVGVCHGDSGSSLHIQQDSANPAKWTQIGITSFVSSAGCENGPGHPTAPHGFTRVVFFLDWIQSVTALKLL